MGESVTDRRGNHGGAADGLTDLLDLCDSLDDFELPGDDVPGVDLGEANGVTCDVADEQRVAVREVALQVRGPAAPVLGHEVDVQLRDLVQRVEPAVERFHALVRAAPQEFDGQVEPEPLAPVGVVGGGVAVDRAVEVPVEPLVPEVVDPRRDGDHQVEVVAGELEVLRARVVAEEVAGVAGELAQLPCGGAEEIDVSGLGCLAEREGDELQGTPDVHGGLPFRCVAILSKRTLGVSSLSEIQDEVLMLGKHKNPTSYLRYLFVKLRKNECLCMYIISYFIAVSQFPVQ